MGISVLKGQVKRSALEPDTPLMSDNLGLALRFILPVYLIVYLVTAFVWRSYLVWRRTGINPVVLDTSDDVRGFVGRMFGLTIVLASVAVIIYTVSPALYRYLPPLPWMERPALIVAGLVLLGTSLIWTLLAQAHMADSWRIGIDTHRPTPLIRRGIFRASRNPIFVGMIGTLTGLFLAIPNALTLVSLVLGVVLIHIQVRMEEAHLTEIHGESYREYCQEVRRWF